MRWFTTKAVSQGKPRMRKAGIGANLNTLFMLMGGVTIAGVVGTGIYYVAHQGSQKQTQTESSVSNTLWGSGSGSSSSSTVSLGGSGSNSGGTSPPVNQCPSPPTIFTQSSAGNTATVFVSDPAGDRINLSAVGGTLSTAAVSASQSVTVTQQAGASSATVTATDATNTSCASATDTITWPVNYTVSLAASTTNATAGSAVTLTATANTNVNPNYIDIYDESTGQWVGTSANNGTTYSTSVTQSSAGTHTYVGYVGGNQSTTGTLAQSSPVTVTWTQPYSVTLAASQTSTAVTGNVTLTATANQDVSGHYLDIYDETAGQWVGTTTSSGTTETATVSQSSGGSHSYIAYVGGDQTTGGALAQSSPVSVSWTGYTVSLNASSTTPTSGSNVTLTATANQSVTGYGYIDIYDQTSGEWVGNINTGSTEQATVSNSSGTHNYLAYVTQSANSTSQVFAQSSATSVTWSQPWGITLSASSTSPSSGQTVTLTATADQSVSGTSYWINIYDETTGTWVADSESGTTEGSYVSETSGSQTYVAYVSNAYSTANEQAESSPETVTWSQPWSVSLNASTTSPSIGQSVTLTATANQNVGPMAYYIDIYDETAGQWVGTAASSGTSTTATVSQSSAATHTYVAYVGGNDSISGALAQSSPVSVTWTAYTVSLTASTTTTQAGNNVTLTATTNQNLVSPYCINIYNQTSGQWIGTGQSGTSYSSIVSQPSASTENYIAYVSSSGSTDNMQAQSSVVSVTWTQPGVTLSNATVGINGKAYTFGTMETSGDWIDFPVTNPFSVTPGESIQVTYTASSSNSTDIALVRLFSSTGMMLGSAGGGGLTKTETQYTVTVPVGESGSVAYIGFSMPGGGELMAVYSPISYVL